MLLFVPDKCIMSLNKRKGTVRIVDHYSVALTQLVEEFHLEVAYRATDFESIRLTVEDVARPGLQLAGYFDHFEPMRLQLIGNAETSYLAKMSSQEKALGETTGCPPDDRAPGEIHRAFCKTRYTHA